MAVTAGDWLFPGVQAAKLYLCSGLSATIHDSAAVGGVETEPSGIEWDGSEAVWSGTSDDKLYLQSDISTTLRDSLSVGAVDIVPTGASWDGTDTPWCGYGGGKFYLQSGQFSATLKTSRATPGGGTIQSISHDANGDAPWVDSTTDKLYLQSGQYTATVKSSVSVSGVDLNGNGASFDGTDTPWSGFTGQKLYLQSGQVTSTLKDSAAMGGIDNSVQDVSIGDNNARLGLNPQPVIPRPRISRPTRRQNRRGDGRTIRYGSRPGWPTTAPPTPLQIIETTRLRFVREPRKRTRPGLWIRLAPPQFGPAPANHIEATRTRLSRPAPRRRRLRGRVYGVAPRLIDYGRRTGSLRGLYRIFSTAAYRFYRSNSAPPVEGDSPFATSSSLPNEPTDTYADGTWWLSVSYFNGLFDSGFLPLGLNGETYLRLDISGAAVTGSPPQAPFQVLLEQRAGGVVRVIALYDESDANSTRADDLVINATYDGSTPGEDPGSPTAEVAIPSAGLAAVAYDLPAQSHGVTVKVRVQARRDGPVWSEGSTVLTTTADAQGPTAPAGGADWRGSIPEGA